MGANNILSTIVKQRAEEVYMDLMHLINSHFAFDEMHPELCGRVENLVVRTIGMHCNITLHNYIAIRIKAGPENYEISIIARNLFTFALMYGVVIPAYLRNGNEYTLYRSENGFPSGTTFDYISQSVYYKKEIL